MIETDQNKVINNLQEILTRLADEQRYLRKDIKSLLRYGVGAAFVTGVAVLGLKIDHDRNYSQLEKEIGTAQQNTELLKGNQYIIVTPCTEETQQKNLYIIEPCTAKTEE